MPSPAIGFIGFGEAGSHLAQGFTGAGASRIYAFDINRLAGARRLPDPEGGGPRRAARPGNEGGRRNFPGHRGRTDDGGGTARRGAAWAALDLGRRFGPDGPATYRDVLGELEKGLTHRGSA